MAEKRSMFRVYLNTAETSGTATWSLIGDGVTELSFDYNPQSTTEQYINADSATTIQTGYQPSGSLSTYANKDNAVYKYLNDIRRNRKIGSSAETQILLVDVYDGNQDSNNPKKYTECPAELQNVVLQIDSYGGSAEDPLTLEATISFDGNATLKECTVTIDADAEVEDLT